MKPTIKVGIPAYNEQHNIGNLINQILKQELDNFILSEILVISDGSNDGTADVVNSISDSRINFINHTDRQGKGVRFNELLSKSDSDVLIQFDADTKLNGSKVLELLARSVTNGFDLVFPKVEPLTARTFIEKLAFFGIQTWEKVLLQLSKEAVMLHRCQGRCRAFSKKFYQAFNLPREADSVEDIYSYCYAFKKDFKIAFVPEAKVNYRLPSNLKDYLKQIRRFIKGPDSLSRFFDPSFVRAQMPNKTVKLKALVRSLFTTWPHISLSYFFLQLYAHMTATMKNQRPIYDYVGSTKKLDI